MFLYVVFYVFIYCVFNNKVDEKIKLPDNLQSTDCCYIWNYCAKIGHSTRARAS